MKRIVGIETLKKRVNEIALQVIRELSLRYRDFEFYVTCVDPCADNLPCVVTVTNEDVGQDIVSDIDIAYSDVLVPLLERANVDLRLYESMTMVALDIFDKKWFTSGAFGFYVKAGEFYLDGEEGV